MQICINIHILETFTFSINLFIDSEKQQNKENLCELRPESEAVQTSNLGKSIKFYLDSNYLCQKSWSGPWKQQHSPFFLFFFLSLVSSLFLACSGRKTQCLPLTVLTGQKDCPHTSRLKKVQPEFCWSSPPVNA